ncbi:MAG: LURP-one-related/scramblase family protein [Crocinitomicaceae bacterium]
MSNPHLEKQVFVDEKVNAFKFKSEYSLYNESGEVIGSIHQLLSTWEKIRKLLVSQKLTPFQYEIRNAQGEVIAEIKKGWTFWLPKIQLVMNGVVIGVIHQRFKLIKPKFDIYNDNNQPIGSIKGNWSHWQFDITSDKGVELGHVSKKWAGIAKELFTTADKYIVNIDPSVQDEKMRMLVLSAALTIDLVLKEQGK